MGSRVHYSRDAGSFSNNSGRDGGEEVSAATAAGRVEWVEQCVRSVFVMFAAGTSIAALFAKLLTPDGRLKSI